MSVTAAEGGVRQTYFGTVLGGKIDGSAGCQPGGSTLPAKAGVLSLPTGNCAPAHPAGRMGERGAGPGKTTGEQPHASALCCPKEV